MEGSPQLADVIEKLRQFKETRGEQFRLTALGVFGSVARGEADPESDIDVVFDAERPNYFLTAEMLGELERALGRRVDVTRIHDGLPQRFANNIRRDAKYV